MFIPYATDAPIYHRPIATVALIAINIAVFVGLAAIGSSYAEPTHFARDLCLTYGFSCRPWQWVTSTFMHAGIVHLLGNMICLWSFGLVVEGKIGWSRFLPLYIGMGVAHCLLQQVLMLFADEGCSLGASGVIFALMAIAMIWAPQNNMSCFIMIFFRPFFFELSILTLVALMMGMQVVIQMFVGVTMTSQVLHLIGAAVGVPVAIVMLRQRWVDCEGWDLFTVYGGRPSDADRMKDAEQMAADKLLADAFASREKASQADTPTIPQPSVDSGQRMPASEITWDSTDAASLKPIRDAIAAGTPDRAFEAFESLANDPLTWELPEVELQQIIGLFHKQGQWRESIPAMVYYLQKFSKHEVGVRLKLAHILIEVEKRPRQAIYVLDKRQQPLQNESQTKRLAQLREKAEQAKSTITNEPPPDEW
jgi:membrane associated rhomboid family serine protease